MTIQFAHKSSVTPRFTHPRKRKNDRKREGTVQFNREQTYEGELLRDSLHGQGTYNRENVAIYDGGFYSNCKEGYASISFPDNSYFEGLFVDNQPFGPGVFTHPNGRQDAGFWKGRKLVRLSRVVDFIIPRLAPTSAAKIKLLQFRRLIPVEEENTSVTDILERFELPENISAPFSTEIYDQRSIFFDKRAFEKTYFASPKRRMYLPSNPSMTGDFDEEDEEEEEEEAEEEEDEDTLEEEFKPAPPPHCVCPTDVFVMEYRKEVTVDICERERESVPGEEEMGILAFFSKYGTDERFNSAIEDGSDWNTRDSDEILMEEDNSRRNFAKVPKIVSWNRNELCTEMLKQIFRFRNFEGKLNFNLSKLMVGARTAFRKTGENEMQCLQFLKMCSLGPAHVIKGLLCAFQISEELMDGRGNNSLMFAAATDRRDVIEVLLNHGVDLNSFNDEGLTPLNLCLLRRLAYANGISNWETAFLPKEIDETQYEDLQAHGFPFPTESISSLDRIFGDGMSLEETSIFGMGSATLSPPMSPPAARRESEKKLTGSKAQMSKTVLNVPSGKVHGSLSVINWEWDFRPGKSVSIVALSNPTPTLNIKIIPKSVRRDEFQRSLLRSNKDKYLFEISFEKKSESDDVLNLGKKKQKKKEEELDSDIESSENSVTIDLDISERIAEIDKTILLLLNKGADTNIAEVPKPSIHLAIYTKDIKTVHNLLIHGANPDSVLHENEGLLTPLHVIVLQKPTLEYVHICDLLLNFKANPDKETLPGYSITEDEVQYLDFNQGRTPLHLLCMRPDLEHVDPHGYLIRIALMLAKAGQKKHLYNGHSYLTLAMLFGNMKLLKALLVAQVFDPRDVLGKNRGTCLHVLVSGELQKRTSYDTSIQMCDLLIGAGADPLKTFKNPRNLLGTCVDYGYRELGMLREARYSDEFKGIKPTFPRGRDSLKDHERVLEYLAVIVGETAKLRRKHFLEVGRFQRYKPSTDRWKHKGMRRGRASRASALENISSATFTESEDRMMKGSKERYASMEERASKLILPSRKRLKSKTEEQDISETHMRKEVEGKKDKKDKKQAEDRRERREVEDRKERKEMPDRRDKRETHDKKDKKETHDKKDKKETHDRMDTKETRDKKEKHHEEQDKKDKTEKKAKAVDAEESEKPPKKKKEEKEGAKHPKKGVLKPKHRMRKRSDLDEDFEEEEEEEDEQERGDKRKGKTKKGEDKTSPEKGKKSKKDDEAQPKDSSLPLRKSKKGSKNGMETVERRESESWKGKGKSGRGETVQKSSREKSQTKQGKKREGSTEDEGEPKRGKKKKGSSEDVTETKKGKKKKGSTDEEGGPKKGKKERQTGDRSRERSKEESKDGSKEVRRGSKRGDTRTSEKEERAEDGKAGTAKKYSSDAKEREKSQGATRTSVPSLSTRGRGSNATRAEASSLRTVPDRRGTEVFPENLRKVLLRLYGSCAKMDVNEFLMPYVVLRDGQLYYKFKGKATKQKEQYSLI